MICRLSFIRKTGTSSCYPPVLAPVIFLFFATDLLFSSGGMLPRCHTRTYSFTMPKSDGGQSLPRQRTYIQNGPEAIRRFIIVGRKWPLQAHVRHTRVVFSPCDK